MHKLPMPRETREIVDRLLGEFLWSYMGKNDMAVVTALLSSAALIIASHSQVTGQDYQELVRMGRSVFDSAAAILEETKNETA